FTGLPSGIPALPSRSGPLPVMQRHAALHETVDFIARYEKNNSDREIGVLVPTRSLQRKFMNRLKGKTLTEPQSYEGGEDGNKAELNFGVPGIKIVNYRSAKGLEFDTVFVPELQAVEQRTGSPEFKMQFYVLISRAREELYLSYSGN